MACATLSVTSSSHSARSTASAGSASGAGRYADGEYDSSSSSASGAGSYERSRDASRRSISVTSAMVTPRSLATACVSSALSQPRLRFVLAQVEEQLALRLGGGDLHQPPVAQHVFVDLGADPVHGERHQPHADRRVEALDRLHEADVAFLHEVAEGQPIAVVAAGDVHDEPQVREQRAGGRVQVVVATEAVASSVSSSRLSTGMRLTASTYASKLPIGPSSASSAGFRRTSAVVIVFGYSPANDCQY